MRNYSIVVLLLLCMTAVGQTKNDTIYHLFDKNNKYIDHSKDKKELMKRNELIPGRLYYLERFFGPDNEKKIIRCKLKGRYETYTKSIKQIV